MKSHDEAVIEMLRNDPGMALDYLRTAFDELDEEGGESAFLMALRHVVEAQGGMAQVILRQGRDALGNVVNRWYQTAPAV